MELLLDLCIVFVFISSIIKSFKNVFIGYFTISYIIVYSITIIPDRLNKVDNSIKPEVGKY